MPLQVAILAGDFLLARASVTLAALRDSEVFQHTLSHNETLDSLNS